MYICSFVLINTKDPKSNFTRTIMKFGKEFKSQMVPEWQEAYMNYDSLKSILKEIHGFKLEHKRLSTPSGLRRQMTMYRPFSGLLVRNHSTAATTTKTASSSGGGLCSGRHYGRHDIEEQAILETRSKEEDRYETKFLMTSDLGGEYELVFFRRLDDEFNKVNKFYKDKVEEVMKEAALLNKQMDALIAFRVKVDNPDGMSSEYWSIEMNQLASDVAASAAVAAAVSSPPGPARTTNRSSSTSSFILRDGRVHMDVVNEIEQSSEGRSENLDNDVGVNGSRAIKRTSSTNTVQGIKPNNFKAARPSPLEILEHVKINNTSETPRSTIKGILNINQDQESSFGKQNLTKVEKQLHSAFIEFYQKLRLLKSYSFLNILAFSKIMKKYDKITSRKASKHYLNMVDKSYLGSSDKITRLMDRVEATFIKHFANANRSKGINLLRPKAKKERHSISFSSGVLSGCTISLLVALTLIVRARNIIGQEGSSQYMVTMFPLYSLFGFTVLHMLMYAMNLYAWRRYRVNYPFIFGFKQGTELGYREVFLLSMGLATLALASVLANLDMEMDVNTKDYKTLTELVPLGLVTLVVLIICCPFNIIYRSSRYFLLRSAFHCICSPLYKVSLPDFFLADQLTSQVQAIRSLEFYICYYGWGDFRHRQNTCQKSDVYSIFYFIMGTIPYSTRLLQCLRRFYDEKDPMQGYNGLKYLSTIVAVLMRTAYTRREATGWWIMAWISSAIAAIVSTYWDIVIDWGLLQKNSKNRWLRDKLLVSRKRIYFGAMVLNVLLRFAWLQTMLNFQVSFLHKEALTAIVASLEIIRRGMWNFFRLENEHLNNVGKYRAFKSVPLPFSYDEDEHKDD